MTSGRRQRVERLIKEYRALLILSRSIDQEGKARLDRLLEQVPSVTTKQLIEAEAFHKRELKKVATMVGLRLPLKRVVEIVEDAEKSLPLHLYVVKLVVEREWFTTFSSRVKNWDVFPPHTTIAFDPSCRTPLTQFDWRLLEASLFEDMAMLWNDAVLHRLDKPVAVGDDKTGLKHFHVLTRSVTRAAFALLEGYLNGIAVDILVTRRNLTTTQQELLDERRPDGRFAPVTLRNKVLQYHKIALDLEHPVIQESNCEEFQAVLGYERDLRDSLMHPTPRLDVGQKTTREQRYFNIKLDEARNVVDAVVGLIRRLDRELDGHFGRVSIWLRDRHDDLYPPETFL